MTDELDKLAMAIADACINTFVESPAIAFAAKSVVQKAAKSALLEGERRGMKLQRERDAVIVRALRDNTSFAYGDNYCVALLEAENAIRSAL